jgi:ferredoxin-NADP reductase
MNICSLNINSQIQNEERMNAKLNYQPHWVREDFVDFILAKVNPMWTLRRIMAKIEAIEPIADEMIKVTLSSNNKFTTYQPGQFVMVTVRIDGVLHQRAYSLVSSPSHDKLVLGIKKQGRVSNYLANSARAGDVIEITQAMGEFTLKDFDTEEGKQPILLVSAGSGITPIIPIAKQALARSNQPVTLIYYSRDPAFRTELETLAAEYAHFNLHIIVDSAEQPAYFDEETLDRLCAMLLNVKPMCVLLRVDESDTSNLGETWLVRPFNARKLLASDDGCGCSNPTSQFPPQYARV